MKINILYRFKIYTHLVVDDNKNLLMQVYNLQKEKLLKLNKPKNWKKKTLVTLVLNVVL